MWVLVKLKQWVLVLVLYAVGWWAERRAAVSEAELREQTRRAIVAAVAPSRCGKGEEKREEKKEEEEEEGRRRKKKKEEGGRKVDRLTNARHGFARRHDARRV